MTTSLPSCTGMTTSICMQYMSHTKIQKHFTQPKMKTTKIGPIKKVKIYQPTTAIHPIQHSKPVSTTVTMEREDRVLIGNTPNKKSLTFPLNKELTLEKILDGSAFPEDIPVKDDIGKIGLMWPRGLAKFHDAAPLLNVYSTKGCPVDCGKNWNKIHITTAIKRGNHSSANEPDAFTYLKLEAQEKVNMGYAKIVKWKDIKDNIPQELKISPAAMIPHKTRKFRGLLDLTFQLRLKGTKLPSVNSETKMVAPQMSMAQMGKVIRRIIDEMATHYNLHHPFKFAKIDIKDGFWRLYVANHQAWNFCYILSLPPTTDNLDEIEILVPNSLQMGWTESPPLFCTATETARDIMEQYLPHLSHIPLHQLETHMYKGSPVVTTTPPIKQSTLVEVYMDDFIGITNNLQDDHIKQLSRAILHGVHTIFPPPAISGHQGQDPISQKKLDEKEGLWDFTKEILGWEMNGNNFTIQLPKKKSIAIIKLTKHALKKQTIPLNTFQELAGKLQHASLGIPNGKGLFTPINQAMINEPPTIALTPLIKQALKDWITIIRAMEARPTCVLELKPGTPHYVGYVDACGTGAGGVWIGGSRKLPQIVWRVKFPKDIKANLVSASNRSGKITNSDLEMAGVLMAWLVLEQVAPTSLQYTNIGLFCDNTPSVGWAIRLASSKSIIAGHLLRALALRQHIHRSSPLLCTSIAGENNIMADIASRSFQLPAFVNSNKSFLNIFNSMFSLPQPHSWREYHLPENWSSRVISCLRGKPLEMALWMKIPGQGSNTGLTGPLTQEHSTKNPSSKTVQQAKGTSLSQLSLLGSGQATTAEEIKSKLKVLKTRFQPSPRPSNWLENVPQSTKHMKLTQSQWQGSWKDTNGKTPHQSPNLHSQSVSQKNASNEA